MSKLATVKLRNRYGRFSKRGIPVGLAVRITKGTYNGKTGTVDPSGYNHLSAVQRKIVNEDGGIIIHLDSGGGYAGTGYVVVPSNHLDRW